MGEWIISGSVIALIGLVLTISKMQDGKMIRIDDDQKQQIANVYRRMDEVKKYQDTTFSRQDMCSLTHRQVTETLDRIENKVDKILNNDKVG